MQGTQSMFQMALIKNITTAHGCLPYHPYHHHVLVNKTVMTTPTTT